MNLRRNPEARNQHRLMREAQAVASMAVSAVVDGVQAKVNLPQRITLTNVPDGVAYPYESFADQVGELANAELDGELSSHPVYDPGATRQATSEFAAIKPGQEVPKHREPLILVFSDPSQLH